jgi:hypothetical protein
VGKSDWVKMSRDAFQVVAALTVLVLGASSALAHTQSDVHVLTLSNGTKPTQIAARDAPCPLGTVDKSGYCVDGNARPDKPAAPPPLLRSPRLQMQNVIQSIQNLKHKCGPTEVWSAAANGCVEND